MLFTFLERAETVQAYLNADLFLFPSNVECSPIVLFECMASATPFLTTNVGNASEIINWCQSGILLKTTIDKQGYSRADISSSAKTLKEVYKDKPYRNLMAKRGFDAWRANFTWELISEKYLHLYKSLVIN